MSVELGTNVRKLSLYSTKQELLHEVPIRSCLNGCVVWPKNTPEVEDKPEIVYPKVFFYYYYYFLFHV